MLNRVFSEDEFFEDYFYDDEFYDSEFSPTTSFMTTCYICFPWRKHACISLSKHHAFHRRTKHIFLSSFHLNALYLDSWWWWQWEILFVSRTKACDGGQSSPKHILSSNHKAHASLYIMISAFLSSFRWKLGGSRGFKVSDTRARGSVWAKTMKSNAIPVCSMHNTHSLYVSM